MPTICFTGRRPKDLCGYRKDAYMSFVHNLAGSLQSHMRPDTVYHFISGGAQGFDQLAFWAVDIVKTKWRPDTVNEVYVPFDGQCGIWPESTLFGQKMYRDMLAHADKVTVLSPKPADNKSVPGLLMARNHAMVDPSDAVIALYPTDDWTNSRGGTAECMRYASQHNKIILQLPYTIVENNLVGVFDSLSELP